MRRWWAFFFFFWRFHSNWIDQDQEAEMQLGILFARNHPKTDSNQSVKSAELLLRMILGCLSTQLGEEEKSLWLFSSDPTTQRIKKGIELGGPILNQSLFEGAEWVRKLCGCHPSVGTTYKISIHPSVRSFVQYSLVTVTDFGYDCVHTRGDPYRLSLLDFLNISRRIISNFIRPRRHQDHVLGWLRWHSRPKLRFIFRHCLW